MAYFQVGSHHLRVGANRRDEVICELRAAAETVLRLLVSVVRHDSVKC